MYSITLCTCVTGAVAAMIFNEDITTFLSSLHHFHVVTQVCPPIPTFLYCSHKLKQSALLMFVCLVHSWICDST